MKKLVLCSLAALALGACANSTSTTDSGTSSSGGIDRPSSSSTGTTGSSRAATSGVNPTSGTGSSGTSGTTSGGSSGTSGTTSGGSSGTSGTSSGNSAGNSSSRHSNNSSRANACATMGPENTPATCSDGCDNEGDGFADCADFGCAGLGACLTRDGGMPITCSAANLGPENTAGACSDGCSNDDDAFVDCADFDCAGIGTCPARTRDGGSGGMACMGEQIHEASNEACSDGCSNDGDQFVDCADFDCYGFADCPPRPQDAGPAPIFCPGPIEPEDNLAACQDGCSNDSNRFVDCADFGCAGVGSCLTRDGGMPVTCSDNVAEITMENTVAACSDGCSNDGDRFVDCEDRDCAGIGTCPAAPPDAGM